MQDSSFQHYNVNCSDVNIAIPHTLVPLHSPGGAVSHYCICNAWPHRLWSSHSSVEDWQIWLCCVHECIHWRGVWQCWNWLSHSCMYQCGEFWITHYKINIKIYELNMGFHVHVYMFSGCNFCASSTAIHCKAKDIRFGKYSKFWDLQKCWTISKCKTCSWNPHPRNWCTHLLCQCRLFTRKVIYLQIWSVFLTCQKQSIVNTYHKTLLFCIGSQGGLMKKKTESKLLQRQVCSML